MRIAVWLVVGVAMGHAACALEELDDATPIAKKSLPPCKDKDKNGKDKLSKKSCLTTTTVGTSGGSVGHPGGVALAVPAGALDHPVEIVVRDDGASGPADTEMYSPVFTFEPDGLQFARPVTVEFAVPASVTASTVYWSRATSGGVVWDRIPAAVSGGIARSQITHFSGGGAGVPSDSFDLHIIKSTTWDRLDSQHIERTDFGAGAAIAYPPSGPPLSSETWNGPDGLPVLGEGMIRNLPAGDMWIQVGTRWLWTSLAATQVIDLSNEHFGTFGRPVPSGAPHPVTIHVIGAETTTVDDAFELLVPDADVFYFGFPEFGPPIVPAGVNDFDLDWDLADVFGSDGLITTADTAYLAQMVPRTTPAPASLPYRQMTKIGIANPADVPQAGGTLNVTLGDLPPTQVYDYTVAADEYQSMFATGAGDPTPLVTPADQESSGWSPEVRMFNFGGLDVQSAYFDLQGEAGGRNVGVIGATADFAYMVLPAAAMNQTIHTGDLAYGVPAGSWDMFAGISGQAAFAVQLACPPADPIPCSTAFGWARQLVNHVVFGGYSDDRLVTATSFAPTIGPIRNLQINGSDAMTIASGVGVHPTISWSTTDTVPLTARPLQAPEVYTVRVSHFTLDSSLGQWRTRRTVEAAFTTTQTSFAIPDGFALQAGETYSLTVSCQRRDPTAGIALIQEPNRFRYPTADWHVSSAPFRP